MDFIVMEGICSVQPNCSLVHSQKLSQPWRRKPETIKAASPSTMNNKNRQETLMDMPLHIHMPQPMYLIENVRGQLTANQKALEILSAITQPVVVVVIVGLYRTGQSYLMNKLAGKTTGFSQGSTVQDHTNGIWMWCLPHAHKADHTLLLLDTEGLGDVKKGDNQNDCWIFSLAILLGSTFVYNSMGAINQQAMDQLHYVTELTDQIRERSSPDQDDGIEDSAEFVSFFPDFVWALRDMTLKMEVNGLQVTADEYLEISLKLKEGSCQEVEKYNLPLLCIRKFFPKKKCFIFYPPTEWKKLSQLEMLQEKEIDPEFLQQVAEFCLYIFKECTSKTLPGGIIVNGPLEWKKAESALAAAKLLEETQKKNEKLMEQKERSYQEHVRQLAEKMEKDRIQLKA